MESLLSVYAGFKGIVGVVFSSAFIIAALIVIIYAVRKYYTLPKTQISNGTYVKHTVTKKYKYYILNIIYEYVVGSEKYKNDKYSIFSDNYVSNAQCDIDKMIEKFKSTNFPVYYDINNPQKAYLISELSGVKMLSSMGSILLVVGLIIFIFSYYIWNNKNNLHGQVLSVV
jgi:hypothetical protein